MFIAICFCIRVRGVIFVTNPTSPTKPYQVILPLLCKVRTVIYVARQCFDRVGSCAIAWIKHSVYFFVVAYVGTKSHQVRHFCTRLRGIIFVTSRRVPQVSPSRFRLSVCFHHGVRFRKPHQPSPSLINGSRFVHRHLFFFMFSDGVESLCNHFTHGAKFYFRRLIMD